MHLGIKNIIGGAKKYLFGDGSYSQNIVISRAPTVTAGMLSQGGLSVGNLAYLLDSNASAFHCDGSGVGSWLQIDFGVGNAKELTSWAYTMSATNFHALWNIQWSDNGTVWTTAYTGLQCNGVTYASCSFSGAGAHRYWRSYKTDAAVTGSWIDHLTLTERVVLQPQSYQPTTDIMPTATANVTGNWTYSAISEYSGTPAYCAANNTAPGSSGVNYTTWNSTSTSAPAWWQAAKNNGVPETIGAYRIWNGSTPRCPTAFQLWGSNTGAFAGEHTVLDTRSGLVWATNEAKTFNLAATATFLYYRIYMTAGNSDSYYNLGEVEFFPAPIPDCVVVTGAATVAPDAGTGASVFTATNVAVDGGSLAPSTNSKGLIGFVSGSVRCYNGGRIHIDKLGKAGNLGNLTVLDLVPASIKRKLKNSLASFVVLGEGAAGAPAGTPTASAAGPGYNGSAATAMQTGGGASGQVQSTGASGTAFNPGGKGGPCCGGAGSGGEYWGDSVPSYRGPAGAYGGPGGAGGHPSYGASGPGDPPGTGGALQATGAGGGLLMLFTPLLSLASGCIVSADGAGGTTNTGTWPLNSGGAGGGCVVAVTSPGGYINNGTVRANGGVGTPNSYGATMKPGNGGAGSVNIFTV